MDASRLTFAGRLLVASGITIAGAGIVAYGWWVSERLPHQNYPIFLPALPVVAAAALLTTGCLWIASRLGIQLLKGDGLAPPDGMVPYFDPEANRTVLIPASELRPGTAQVRLRFEDGSEQLVWMLAEHLQQGNIQHPPFGDEIRTCIEHIHNTFQEHRDISIEEWEYGFRRDRNPESEIALWLHAAEAYEAYGSNDPSPERRKDVYRCIIACLTTSHDTVWHVFQPEHLGKTEAEEIVQRFFCQQQ